MRKFFAVLALLPMMAWGGGVFNPSGGAGGGGDALTTSPLSQFAATTSAQLAGVLTNETGSGLAVFGTAPTIAGGSITGLTGLAIRDTSAAFDLTLAATSSATLSAGRTLTLDMGNVAHTLAFGTTANTITFPNVASDTVVMLGASQTLTNKTLTSPTLTAPVLGTPASGNGSNLTALNATQLTSGTVPTAQLGSGTANSGTFLRGDQTWAAAGGGSGTVTNTGGNLTSNSLVLGAGTVDTKVAAGLITDGTSKITLGVAGTSVGSIDFKNATSGTATIGPPTGALGTYTVTLPNAASTLPIFGQQITFSGPTAARTITLPDAAFTAARTDAANTFTGHQTIEGVTSTGATGTNKFVFDTSPTVTNLTLANGSTSIAPMVMGTGGSLLTTPAAGAFEADTKVAYYTHAASDRGVIPAKQFITLTSDYTVTSQTAAQKMFNSTTNGQLTLPANTRYHFKTVFYLTTLSGTSGTYGWGVGGTATISQVKWFYVGHKGAKNTGSTNGAFYFGDSFTAVQVSDTNTATEGYGLVEGEFTVTTGGTIIPQLSMSVAAAALVKAGSFFECEAVGSDTVTNVGNWN